MHLLERLFYDDIDWVNFFKSSICVDEQREREKYNYIIWEDLVMSSPRDKRIHLDNWRRNKF